MEMREALIQSLKDTEHWDEHPVWRYLNKKMFHYLKATRGNQDKYDSFDRWKRNFKKHMDLSEKYGKMWWKGYFGDE
jgi:uncharacterized protein YfbU (UPF0304 family)